MIKRIRSIYNKEDFDYSTGIVDPYEFHKTFYILIKNFRVLDNEPLPKWTYNAKIFIAISTTFVFFLTILATYHWSSLLDVLQATEVGSYCIIMFYELMMLWSTKIDLKHYHSFCKTMREDFYYVCTSGQKYRKKYFESQLQTWKLSLTIVVFIVFIMLNMVFIVIGFFVYVSLTYKSGDGRQRIQVFPFWIFDINLSNSPLYEMIFLYSCIIILLYGYVYAFMLQTGVVWVRQITTKVDLIIYHLQDLMEDIHTASTAEEKLYNDNLLKLRMREIVIQHHSMYSLLQNFAGVYKKFLMYEQKLSGPVVCLTAFGVSETLAKGKINGILMLLCIATMTLVFIPCYLCTFLGIKIRSICDACWDTEFWEAGTVIRPYLVLIMQRSMRPLPLQAPGFADISLNTFSSTMASAYSLFNMLRQANVQFD